MSLPRKELYGIAVKVMMDARALRRKDAFGGGNAIEDRVTCWNPIK